MNSASHQFDVDYEQAKHLPIGAAMDSDAFAAGGHMWKVKLYPRGSAVSDNGAYLSIHLELANRSHTSSVSAFCEAFLMDKNGKPSPYGTRSLVCEMHKKCCVWPRFIALANLEENFLSEGLISIVVAVVVISDNSIPVPQSDVGNHLGALLDSMDGTDVSFTIDGETFHGHRAVLAARSPVFRDELYGSMSDDEGTTLSITLHGMAPETFRMMLAFIYTDSLTEDDEHGEFPATVFQNLLAAADRYALHRLKLLCARKLLDDVTLDTVAKTFTVAEMYTCPELKNKCLDFIVAEANDEFFFSEGYVQLGLNFPCILPDLRQRRRHFNSGHLQQPHRVRSSETALVGRTMDSAFYQFDVEYEQANQLAIGAAISSVAFSAGGHLWRVMLYPRGRSVSDNGAYMSIYLELLSKSSVTAFSEVLLMDKDGQPPRAGTRSGIFLFHKQECGWPQFISLADLENNYLKQGRLRFICAITIMSDSSIRMPPSDLGKQLGMLLESTTGTDVSFIIDGATFHAHRAVLAARSPVFRAELLGSMAEATMPSITIHEITPSIFKIVLKFIYTDSFPGDDELGGSPTLIVLMPLLAASDRYALDRLRLFCAQKLWDIVTVNTVLFILVCSDRYSCLELKDKCLDFIVRKDVSRSVFLTQRYIMLVQKYPHLIEELRGRFTM